MPLTRRDLLVSAAGAATLAAAAGCASTSSTSGHGATPGSTPASGAPSTVAARTGPPETPRHLPPEVTHGPDVGHAVALTFHGSGPAMITRQVLSEVERAGARVTVLAVGTWLAEQPDLARRILDGGHDLGNHTEHHGPMAQMDEATAYAEIVGCAARLRALTGSIRTWFRPSQMHNSTPLVRAAARRVGYPTVLSYDLDSLDHTDPGADAITRTVLGSATAGSIVSMHLGHPGTVRALPSILDGLRTRGLRPVTATELLG